MVVPPTFDPPASLEALAREVTSIFTERFGAPPRVRAAAPGRVNLIGEHIDYNDGFVMPMAIDRYTVVAASPLEAQAGGATTIFSANMGSSVTFPAEDATAPSWAPYVEGVLEGFRARGVETPPFQAVVGSNVPPGSGLSSSASLEVAVATALEALTGHTLDRTEKALLCQCAEHDYAGTPCGIMDQFTSVFGEADALLRIDCQSMAVETIPFGGGDVSVLITNSNVAHALADGAYAARRAQCEAVLRKIGASSWREVSVSMVESKASALTAVELGRARHVAGEIARTTAFAPALQAADWRRCGALMYESHESLRSDYEVSCPELDTLVKIARDIGPNGGVYGARMTGGGFGGCTVTLVEGAQADTLKEAIVANYTARTGIQTNCFASRPARGAHLL